MTTRNLRHLTLSLGSALAKLAHKECCALEYALASDKDYQEVIHQARKSSRRLRSVLGFFNHRHHRHVAHLAQPLKQLTKKFSSVRDANVAADTARLLAATQILPITDEILNSLDKSSAEELNKLLKQDPHLFHQNAFIPRVCALLEMLPWDIISKKTTQEVLSHATKGVDKARKKALKRPTSKSFHRWRRRARQLRYQIEFVHKAQRMRHAEKKDLKHYRKQHRKLGQITNRLGWKQDLKIFLLALERLPTSEDLRNLQRDLCKKPPKSIAISHRQPAPTLQH